MFLAHCDCNLSIPIFPLAEATDFQLHVISLLFCLYVFTRGMAGPEICKYVHMWVIALESIRLCAYLKRIPCGYDYGPLQKCAVMRYTDACTHVHTDGDTAKQRPIVCRWERAALLQGGWGENIPQTSAGTKTFALELLPACRTAHRVSPSHRVDGLSQWAIYLHTST